MTHFPKTAFISGAGRNIGRVIALHLAGQGVNVVVNGSSERAACETAAAEAEAGGRRRWSRSATSALRRT